MIRGSIVALVTPMHLNGKLDEVALAQLVEFHCEQGTDAIVSVGTTGESPTLDYDEHMEVIERTIALVKGRMPVIAGTGGNSTDETLYLTQRAKAVGADACLLVTPYYNKPTQEGLYRHFKIVAEAVDIPQILYNVPGRTAVDMLPPVIERLSVLPNIVGIKEATGNLERSREIQQRCGTQFAVYSGDDITAMQGMLQGAVGTISVTANVAPRAMQRLCAAAIAGDTAQAQALDQTLADLHKAMFVESNPIPVKWALHAMGLIDRGIRLPLTELSEAYHAQVRAAMQRAGVSS